jgi:tetratricopeptide (TPR) repeat protein
MLKWFSAREATEVGAALADDFVLHSASGSTARQKGGGPGASPRDLQKFMQKFLQRVDRDARPLQLNLFKRAKLANTFKWRLLEKGVEKDVVEELTQALVLRLTTDQTATTASSVAGAVTRPAGKPQELLAQGDACMARGAYAEAVGYYRDLLSLEPRHAVARNNLGAALSHLGHYRESEEQFRRAVGIRANYVDAQYNLGMHLQVIGRIAESEMPLRRALKLRPGHADARATLGMTFVLLGRTREARDCLERTLNGAPRNLTALAGMGQLAALEGRFDEAEAFYKRTLEVDPKTPGPWAGLVRLRKMTSADSAWLKGAEEIAASGLTPADEATMRFAIGKYYDDVGDFARAFRSYQRGNELHKLRAPPYDRDAHRSFVDDMIRVYSRESLAEVHAGASDSAQPVFVTGMMRSGTSLVEQIIASHPSASGAGELSFWTAAVGKRETTLRREPPGERLSRQLAKEYLGVLKGQFPDALRVVDKATVNSDHLGVIHAVLPNARMLYLQRDPIDTCLSCYFQQFSSALNFTTDLADLVHYYREHRRLVEHWRAVMPAGTLLVVPYAELVADQETWTRRIIEFIGLPWDERCLGFHQTQRTVATASTWQVRQKVYKTSVGRWRNYEKFIGPLLELKGLD